MSELLGNIRCRSGRPRLRALPAAIVCVGAILSGCSDAPSASGAAAERVYKVEVAPTDRQDVSVHVNAVGTVYASAQAEIRPMVDGIVDEIFYERGSTVERGQMLVRLDDRKAVARVQLSKATLDNARARMSVADRNLHRAQRLFDVARLRVLGQDHGIARFAMESGGVLQMILGDPDRALKFLRAKLGKSLRIPELPVVIVAETVKPPRPQAALDRFLTLLGGD